MSVIKRTKEYRLKTGEIINDMIILNQTRISNNKVKAYELKCKYCNSIHTIREYDLIKKQCSCPTCSNRKITIGVNDVATTNPELMLYFKDKTQCYKYTKGSKQKVVTICPICKSEKVMMISSINSEYSCNNKQCKNYFRNKINDTKHVNRVLKDDYLEITHPYVIKFLKNKEDRFYSHGSKQKVIVKCPRCGTEKEMRILHLTERGFSCSTCGDGNSYPNKFIECLVRQSRFEFFTEQRFDWSIYDNTYKIYDIYIPSLNCIVENHGKQHYERGFEYVGGRTLEDEQINDKLKREIALKNSIQNYFEIDCRKSSLNWIRDSIVKSGLLDLLHLEENNVNWQECNKYAVKSKMYSTCELWNNGSSVKDISIKLCVNNNTITKYLQQGREMKLCDYQEYKARVRGKNTRLVCLNSKIFYSIAECARHCNVDRRIMNKWLLNPAKMPQEYIDLGLRYYNPEIDGDIEQYEQYIETKAM